VTSTPAGDTAAQSVDPSESEPANPRLDRWINRTTVPLDLIALFTIWLTVIPFGAIHRSAAQPLFWYIGRITISVIYGIDMAVRTYLAHRRWHYLTHHPVGVLAVIMPVIRIAFSLRLLKSMFKKGNTAHFLFVSVALLVNLMIIVWGFERANPDANITSIGIAIWWGCVTVFTVGYGDYYPITFGGRVAAVAIMLVGLTTAAVITAQIASSFMDEAQSRRTESAPDSSPPVAGEGEKDTEVDERLRRIEHMLRSHLEPGDQAD
jgi:voltage-gated potassium channel